MPITMQNSQSHRALMDPRQKMIEETNAFLTWALSEDRHLPRIPVQRVDQGGFREILSRPGARALVVHFWKRLLTSPFGPE